MAAAAPAARASRATQIRYDAGSARTPSLQIIPDDVPIDPQRFSWTATGQVLRTGRCVGGVTCGVVVVVVGVNRRVAQRRWLS